MKKKLMEAHNLTKRFGGLIAVNNLSFDLYDQEILGLIGPNGAGKTTVFNLITGFIKPTSGSILFNGRRIDGHRTSAIASKGIIRTFQIPITINEHTVFENIMTASYLKRNTNPISWFFNTPSLHKNQNDLEQQAKEILEFTDLIEKRDSPTSLLTYGMKQFTGLSIALAANPKILLLDEQTAGMSGLETKNMIDMIKKLPERGISVVVIGHDLRVIMGLCERIIVMDFGKKIAEGSREEVVANPDVIKAYLGNWEDKK